MSGRGGLCLVILFLLLLQQLNTNAVMGQEVQSNPAAASPPAQNSAPPPPAAAKPAEAPSAPLGCGIATPAGQESQSLFERLLGVPRNRDLTDEEVNAIKRGFPIFPSGLDSDTTSAKFTKLRQTRNILIPLIAACTAKLERDGSRAYAFSTAVPRSEWATGTEAEQQKRIAEAEQKRIAEAEQRRFAEAEQDRKDLEYLQHLLERVDETASETLIPESDQNRFKTTLSYVYAFVVGMVIVGFYAIAIIDPNVRQAIFSGQAGIQFVTLFSLVIAIILFGIIGVLEAKELSALLGGIAGYILGRGTTDVGRAGGGGQPQGAAQAGGGGQPQGAAQAGDDNPRSA